MCFDIPKGAKELTAKEDIVCYKIIKKNNKSLFQRFKYSPNTTYRLKKKLKFEKDVYAQRSIERGFHSYCEHDRIDNFYSNAKIVQMIIPKGAKYYKNTGDNEYVSTSIRTGTLKKYVPQYDD